MFIMQRKVACYLLLFLFLTLSARIKAQNISDTLSTLNLGRSIEIAIKNNIEIQRSNIRAETEKEYLQEAKTNLLPNLNASYSQGISSGKSIDPSTNSYVNQQISYANPAVGSTLTVFNGFQLWNTIRRNSLSYQAARFEEQQAKDNLTLNVVLAYLQVLTNQDLVELSVKQQETSLKQVQRLEVLNKDGAVAPGEYYDLKGQYANDRMAVVNASNNFENSKLALTQLLNIPYNKNLKFEKFTADQFLVSYNASAEEVYEAALQNLAMVKAVDAREKSAKENVKVIRSGYYPSVLLNGGLSSNYSSSEEQQYSDQLKNNISKYISVGLAIPLFNSFKTKHAVAIARLNQQDARLTAKSTRVQLQQLTEQAYFNMTSSKERYTTLLDQVNAFGESFRIAEIRFNAGAINSVDYLVIKNNLDNAKLNLISARYDFILRKKILDFYSGSDIN